MAAREPTFVAVIAGYLGRTSRAAAISASTAPFMSSRFRLIPWPSTIMWATRIAFWQPLVAASVSIANAMVI